MTTVDEGVTSPRRTGPLQRLREFSRPPRVLGVDVARGLAVLGMVGAHLGATADDVTWSDPSTWDGVVNGRSSLLFAMLAGISVTLISRGRARPGDTRLQMTLVRRGLAVLAIGLVVELMNAGVAVILPLYGLLFVISALVLHWSTRRLWIVSGTLAVLGPFAVALLHALSLGASGPGLSLTLFGLYPVTAWLTMLLAGMAIGRLRLTDPRVGAGLLLGGVVLATAGYGAGHLIGSDRGDPVAFLYSDAQYYDEEGGPTTEPGYLTRLREQGELTDVWSTAMQYRPHTAGAPEVVGSGGFAAAVIGLSLAAVRLTRRTLLPLAALGSVPLTGYVGHLLLVDVLAGGPFGGYEGTNALWGWTSLAMVVLATGWVALLGRGPLERWVARVSRPRED